jgi:phospholipid/cholesterol/gamma-HCH transport system substrate-binding protein
MRRQLERFGRWLIAIAVLMFVAAACAIFIFANQRLSTPLADNYDVVAEFEASAGVTPGLGQPVNVAGVRVGTISDVVLKNGRARVTLQISPSKLKHVFKDASAALVPRTPLKDMQVEVMPGTKAKGNLPKGAVIQVQRTTIPVDSDELTNALDADTRQFFAVLVDGTGRGLDGRGKDLRAVLKALGPTTEQLRTVGDSLAARRHELRRLVHNLAILGKATADKDRQLAQVIDASNATLSALANQEGPLRSSIAKLPGTLSAAHTSLGHATDLANELQPTLDALRPAIQRLPATLRASRPLVARAEPLIRTQIRPLVRELQPIARDLVPLTRDLSAQTPDLTSAFRVLNYIVNELGYNPPGSDEGGLYWLAWFAHNGASFIGQQDANGPAWRGLALLDCVSLTQEPLLSTVLQGLLTDVPGC